MAPQTNTSRDRLGSVGKRGLNLILLQATDGRCAICGDNLNIGAPATDPRRFEVCHVVPAATFTDCERGGFITNNLFAGCRSCNRRTGDRDLTPAVSAFRIPGGVTAWTDAQARRAGGAPVEVATNNEHDDLWMIIDNILN